MNCFTVAVSTHSATPTWLIIRLVSSWALLACAAQFLCVLVPANQILTWGKKEKKWWIEGKWICKQFLLFSLPHFSVYCPVSDRLNLPQSDCPSDANTGISERRYASPHRRIKLSRSLLHQPGSCCCVCLHFIASDLEIDSFPCESRALQRSPGLSETTALKKKSLRPILLVQKYDTMILMHANNVMLKGAASTCLLYGSSCEIQCRPKTSTMDQKIMHDSSKKGYRTLSLTVPNANAVNVSLQVAKQYFLPSKVMVKDRQQTQIERRKTQHLWLLQGLNWGLVAKCILAYLV